MEKKGLCYRCEHRAKFIETEMRPRFECGVINQAKGGCYMYKPVAPCLLKPDKDDPRPQFGPAMISSRSYYDGVAEGEYILHTDGKVVYWRPESEDTGKNIENQNGNMKSQIQEAISILKSGTDYEKLHLIGILEQALDQL